MNPRQAMFEITRRRIRPALISEAMRKFEFAKEWVLNEVENHPVSKALNGYSSGILGVDRGTLFGFFGFDDGRQPITELLGFLENNISFKEGASGNKRGLVNAYIYLPSKDMLSADESMKLRWENGTPSDGWPILIENGLSGLEYYLYNGYSRMSRSGEGVQLKHAVRGKTFEGVPYLQPIFTEFRKKLITG